MSESQWPPADLPSPPLAPPPPPAAVIHGAGSLHIDVLMDDFVAELRRRGFSVGGVVQRNVGRLDDCAEQMLLVDVATERAFDITQYLGSGSQSCRVDPAGVVAAGAAIRQAIERGVDLIVINKFAGLEAGGEGLADEMLEAMASGIPVLTSVGGRFLNEWHEFTGGLAVALSPDPAALWRWWGAAHLYRDLADTVTDGEVTRLTIGAKWIALETEGRVGLAARPKGSTVEPSPEDIRALIARGARAVADLAATSWNPLAVAVGVAAINAQHNHTAVVGDGGNGLDLFAEAGGHGDGPLVAIGAFPDLIKRRPDARIIDENPGPGQYPAAAADWLLPRAGGALITASTLANRTLPRLLNVAAGRPAALVGPGTPLSPRLFAYGLHALSGFVVTDAEAVTRIVAGGGGAGDIKAHGRQVTLTAP